MVSSETARDTLDRTNSSVYADPPAPRGRPTAMVLLVVALVALIGSAALLTDARTPRGVIVAPPATTPAAAAAVDTATPTTIVAVEPQLFLPAAVVTPTEARSTILRGLTEGIESVTVNGQPAVVEPGAFTAELVAGVTEANVVAVAPDGRTVEATVGLTGDLVAPEAPTVAVHVALKDMVDPAKWLPIIAMARDGQVNAVQIDIKDETGEVGYQSAVPLATTVGAVLPRYDPTVTIAELHSLGVTVIGRVVCFLDPKLGAWAWAANEHDMVVQHADGSPLSNEYGSAGFANVANPKVRQYLWDLTAEAIGFGFDEIIFDYVRRPEGDTATMAFPGLDTSPSVAVARFVRDSAGLLAERDVRFGISVFGISATRPDEVSQDLRLLAPLVDYVAPMLYPALWGDGEYGVEKPWRTPGLIVDRALVDFHRVVAGSGAALVPWLQDFDAGRFVYGADQVREQIDSTLWKQTSGFLLWNPATRYDSAALDPQFLVSPAPPGPPTSDMAVVDSAAQPPTTG